ncbi:hypothetical protein ASPZODRAFT_76535, partial [Penicilliopsis zonata CBS 506.65]
QVGNTGNYTRSDWADDVSQAVEAHIDAFALNIAYGDPINTQMLPMVFDVAEEKGFHLFFSFDYAGNGPWPRQNVINLLLEYTSRGAYYKHQGQPFVSTFEGPAQAADWETIKQIVPCFFMPDWSSLGAKAALEQGAGVVDGLFSWAAWPWGPNDMNTYVDASYLQFLNQTGTALPYMMPVSPWFYTNLPQWEKNWLWRGDDLWYTRWQEVLYIQPEFVEILTWNDYGESHYIGPLRDKAMTAFAKAPYNYATDMPHDGWRLFLPFVIDLYKTGTATITREGLTVWYRTQPKLTCFDGNTTGNTASQLQFEYKASDIVQDKVFYSALLAEPADIIVTVGGSSQAGSWTSKPDDGIGIYHGSVPLDGRTGDVVVTLTRKHVDLAKVTGSDISTDCGAGFENWNAWVGTAEATADIKASPKLHLKDQVCIKGTAVNNFVGLCEFTCQYGYCPLGACVCLAMGKQREEKNVTNTPGFPLAGESPSYLGLCAYACNHGYCPPNACGHVEEPLIVPNVSDFLPPACIAGTGDGNLQGLCDFSCHYGFCPINACKCTKEGALIDAPKTTVIDVKIAKGADPFKYNSLCSFACPRGYCPTGACSSAQPLATGPGGVAVPIDPSVWREPSPVMSCEPPCTLIPAPLVLPTNTTISFPVWWTDITYSTLTNRTQTRSGTTETIEGYSEITVPTAISIPPVTTTAIEVWEIIITAGQGPGPIYMTPSVRPPPFYITYTPVKDGVTLKPSSSKVTPPPHPTKSGPPDSKVNSRSSSFKKGDPPGPKCTSACGGPCKLTLYKYHPYERSSDESRLHVLRPVLPPLSSLVWRVFR